MKKPRNKKLKLKPSARDKRRYFIISGENLDNKKVEDAILDYIGILGFAKSAYKTVKTKKKEFVGSCLRESLNNVRAGLVLDGFKIEKVSGTLKGLD